MGNYTIRYVGDQALSVEFANEISIETNQKVRALKEELEARGLPGLLETIPTYRALLIRYDPLRVGIAQLEEAIARAADATDNAGQAGPVKRTFIELPVLYEGEYAPDLEEIAKLENKTVDEIIRIHSQSDYYVYMLSFSPGHPSCARFENPFSFKRRATPRVRIPAGCIVVQLGLSDVIPFDQPCGWNIIGTTPVLACDYRKENPFLFSAGCWLRHIPIDRAEFMEIKRQVELGEYECRRYEKEG